MSKLTLWYSVSNGGDGSAYPQFFETERLTEMDQELMEEGWGECCNGSIEIEGENLKIIRPKIITTEEFIKDLKVRLESKYNSYYHKQIEEFIKELENE